MNREDFRQALTAAVETLKASWSEYALIVEYDNRIIVDTQTQKLPFLCVDTVYLDGNQVDLGDNPNHRTHGQVHVAAAVKEGAGSAEANRLLDHFAPGLHLRSLGAARMYGMRPAQKVPHKGWVYYPILIPFDFDTIS